MAAFALARHGGSIGQAINPGPAAVHQKPRVVDFDDPDVDCFLELDAAMDDTTVGNTSGPPSEDGLDEDDLPPPLVCDSSDDEEDGACTAGQHGDGGEAGECIECPADFMPARAFAGARRGMAFKRGHLGLGYYRDRGALPQAAPVGGSQRSSAPPPSPCGGLRAAAVQLRLQNLLAHDGGQNGDGDERGDMTDMHGHAAPLPEERAMRAAGGGDVRPRAPRRGRGKAAALTIDDAKMDGIEECAAQDTAHRAKGIWAFDSANAGGWTGSRSYLMKSAADAVMLQETRRQDSQTAEAEDAAQHHGWRLSLRAANPTEAGRTSAGVGIAVRRHVGMSGQVDALIESFHSLRGRVAIRRMAAVCRGGLALVSVYFHDAPGIPPENVEMMRDLAVVLAAIQGPWVLAADWNMEPEEVIGTGFPALVDGTLVAPSLPTCNAATYDYFLINKGLQHAVAGVAIINDAGIVPHCPVRLYLRGAPRKMLQRQLVAPRGFGAHLPSGCLPEAAALPLHMRGQQPGRQQRQRQQQHQQRFGRGYRGDDVGGGSAADGGTQGRTESMAGTAPAGRQHMQEWPRPRPRVGGGSDEAARHLEVTDGCNVRGDGGCSDDDATAAHATGETGGSDWGHAAYADWIALTEKELNDICSHGPAEAVKHAGRADGPRFAWRPALPLAATERPAEEDALAAWKALKSWCIIVRGVRAPDERRPRRAEQSRRAAEAALRRIQSMAATPAPAVGTCAAPRVRGRFGYGPWTAAAAAIVKSFDSTTAARQVEVIVDDAIKEEEKKLASSSRASWLRWIAEGAAAGLRRQHRFVRGPRGWAPTRTARAPAVALSALDNVDDMTTTDRRRLLRADDLQQPLAAQQVAEAEARDWGALWAAGCEVPRIHWPDDLGPMPPRPSTAALRRAAATFPAGTGLSWDRLHPRALCRLADWRLEKLIDILMWAEATGQWPAAIHYVTIVLLPKGDGAYRPIGLFPPLVRLWMRLRRDMVVEWEARNDRDFLFAGQGRGAQRAAWAQASRAEVAAASGVCFAQVLLDLAKCFERVPHDLLVAEAVALNYPLPLLRLSLAAYGLPRVMTIDGVCSSMVIARQGITAGSGMATTELRVLLLRLLDRVRAKYPGIGLAAYVDDIAADVAGTDARAIEIMCGAGDMLCSGLRGLRLQLSAGKCKVVTSSKTVTSTIAQRLAAHGVVAATWAKALGVAVTAGSRRCVAVQAMRFRTFAGRLARYNRIRRARVDAARLLRTGGMAVMTYGDAVLGVSPTALARRRTAAATAVSSPTRGRDTDISLVLAGADPAVAAHVDVLGQWADAVWEGWVPKPILEHTIAAARRKLSRARRPWATVAGPAAAAVATASRIGWRFEGATQLVTDAGDTIDLSLDSPAVLRAHVADAVERWRARRIEAKYAHLDSGGVGAGPELRPAIRLLKATSRGYAWQSCHQAALRSAMTGTQWTQERKHRAGMVDEPDCQLCKANGTSETATPAGTAVHRIAECPCAAASLQYYHGGLAAALGSIRSRIAAALGMREPATTLNLYGEHGVEEQRRQRRQQMQQRQRRQQREQQDTPSPHDNLDSDGAPGDDDGHADDADHAPPNPRPGTRRRTLGGWRPTAARPWGKGLPQHAVDEEIKRAWQEVGCATACSRGLIRRYIPPASEALGEGTFAWVLRPEDGYIEGTVYSDASMLDSTVDGCQRLGWAFVACDDGGNVVAAAHGVPPRWVTSVTGAEGWALLMAARIAIPGTEFLTDSATTVHALRKGSRWATAARRPLARIWRSLHQVFDTADHAKHVNWMPAHLSSAAAGTAVRGDGLAVTAIDIAMNDKADHLAKSAAARYRAPALVRARVGARRDAACDLALALGRLTWAANHAPSPPARDSTPPLRGQASLDVDTIGGQAPPVTARAAREDRPVYLGGHDLFRDAHGRWKCAVCLTTARVRSTMAAARCPGSAVQRWATAAASGDDYAQGPDEHVRHARCVTGSIVWCMRCGAYSDTAASQVHAVRLARACLGKPTSGGAITARARLRAARHPRTNADLNESHVPEPACGQRPRCYGGPGLDAVHAAWGGAAGHSAGRMPRQQDQDQDRDQHQDQGRRPPQAELATGNAGAVYDGGRGAAPSTQATGGDISMVPSGSATDTPAARMEQLRSRVRLKAEARHAAAGGDHACIVAAASIGVGQSRKRHRDAHEPSTVPHRCWAEAAGGGPAPGAGDQELGGYRSRGELIRDLKRRCTLATRGGSPGDLAVEAQSPIVAPCSLDYDSTHPLAAEGGSLVQPALGDAVGLSPSAAARRVRRRLCGKQPAAVQAT